MRPSRDYRAGIEEGLRWHDYVRRAPQLASYVAGQLLCRLGSHEWHWFRQTGGRKKKICVRCDAHAHKETP